MSFLVVGHATVWQKSPDIGSACVNKSDRTTGHDEELIAGGWVRLASWFAFSQVDIVLTKRRQATMLSPSQEDAGMTKAQARQVTGALAVLNGLCLIWAGINLDGLAFVLALSMAVVVWVLLYSISKVVCE